ncbi:hypothetical protein [Limnoglobus roseus]|uniref:Uncharacterized protein n=1 Tax=Limnoglobus roseus TaxID=2598579 RepID=A0A5C1A9A2_9BACT|nr:hypothetical protein [Limnoglobus roseus]QEL14783.1 hypothetical protein PX52LOC_01677 [Limnoglobus roseus]
MSFLYPRVISLSRPNQDAMAGAQPYSGLQIDNEVLIASGIPAHIQVDKQNSASPAKLPGDAVAMPVWKIIVKVARGLARSGDVITDDLGNRYQVISADWGPMVTTCRSQLLQT